MLRIDSGVGTANILLPKPTVSSVALERIQTNADPTSEGNSACDRLSSDQITTGEASGEGPAVPTLTGSETEKSCTGLRRHPSPRVTRVVAAAGGLVQKTTGNVRSWLRRWPKQGALQRRANPATRASPTKICLRTSH